MTNHWIDIKNSDCVLIMGSNPAENHPISFKWVLKAQEKGATVIHIDPRFTRTSAKADFHAALRPGSDIAILGGLMKYIIENKKYFNDYVINYTNASYLVSKDFKFNDGLFSGLNEEKDNYDKSSWQFQTTSDGVPKQDTSLTNPNCVFQILKKHYSRYTLKNVSSASGLSTQELTKLYSIYSATGTAKKAGTIMYAMGWTQHSVGVQNIRAMAMVQLLLGNMGVAGGGVNALRGECNVQGSTDQALLFHILPGYLKTPLAGQDTLEQHNKVNTPVSNDPKSANWWKNYPKYSASLLKAMYSNLTPEEGYQMLPRIDSYKASEYSWLPLWDRMYDGKFEGALIWGMNPACSGADTHKVRKALTELDWMVNVNIFQCETSDFWKGPGMDPSKIKTETFFIPCASAIEKEGTIANSGRWIQWRYAGPEPLNGLLTDGHYFHELWEEVAKLYEEEGGVHAKPITELSFDNMVTDGHFDPRKTARLLNGWFMKDTVINGKQYYKGHQVPSFALLQDDGSTCSGNWLYCNMYTDSGNQSMSRDLTQTPEQANIGLYPKWTWCWPVNRRILYNRASVNLDGVPYNPKKAVISWTGDSWAGDVPDGGSAPGTINPSIMRTHGVGQLYGSGLADGPLPEYYEPLETPLKKHPFSNQLSSPLAFHFQDEEKAVADPRFPYIGTTYRVTEHWQTGSMTRWEPWLVELEPQMFAEISPALAEKIGVKNGEKVTLESLRGKVWAVAMVTERIKDFKIDGNEYHMIGLPWHYGWLTPDDGGDSANILTAGIGDPNTGIPEYKAFMLNARKWQEGEI